MNNRQKTALFAVLAAIMAASTAVGSDTVGNLFLVLRLVLMGVFLFIAGYYAGLSKNK